MGVKRTWVRDDECVWGSAASGGAAKALTPGSKKPEALKAYFG